MGRSRYKRYAYASALEKIRSQSDAIGYSDLLWGSRPRALVITIWTLIVVWLALSGVAAVGGPHGWFTLLPILLLFALLLLLPIWRAIRRKSQLKERPAFTSEAFVVNASIENVPLRVVNEIRGAIARSYQVRPELIMPWDNEKSLRPLAGASTPFGFEVLRSASNALGIEMGDVDVDRILLRVHSTAHNVKDIVVIMGDELMHLKPSLLNACAENGVKMGAVDLDEHRFPSSL
jgi:hypothetical protein